MLEYVGFVNRGLVHKTNDDAALLKHSVIHEGFFKGKCSDDEGVFAVADGVGSISHSELASRFSLNELRECDAKNIEQIRGCICEANRKLIEITENKHLDNLLSTTLCVASVLNEKVISFNLGNSRLYRYRNGYLRQMTKDQTKVQSLIDMGLLDPKKADEHPEKNVINQFLGCSVFQTDWIDVKEYPDFLKKEDILMLCSDGIHEYVGIELLEDIFSVDGDLVEKSEIIIQSALDSGGKDNATVVLIRKY